MSSVSRGSDRDNGDSPALRPSRTGWLSERITDVIIARTVAERVRAVSGVADLSRGYAALVATYGAMQRVTGVAVIRPAPEEIRLEVHVVLRADATKPDIAEPGSVARDEAGNGDGDFAVGIFPAVAAEIREVVRSTMEEMSLPSPSEVDVFIDDIDVDGD
jgi:uncharacterized alkaline shock family protein YloU